MICILGDIHFTSRKKYFTDICYSFLEWFKNWEKNNNDNTLILAGDLVDSHLNGGVVIDLLEKFITYSNFKEIHIVVGNHDKKKQDGYDQLAYEFYKNKPNIFIYEDLTEKEIEGQRILFLPYYLNGSTPMNVRYSNLYKIKKEYDLIVGHFSEPNTSFPGSIDCISNLDKIKTKKICLGHIHTRQQNPDIYIGSIYAGRKNENDNTRSAWYYDGEWKEERLPIFSEFITVTYPNKLPESNALFPIYTILNCGNENLARKKYGNINIRRVTTDSSEIINKSELDFEFNSIKNIDINTLFKDFKEEKKLPEEVAFECEEALKRGIS